MYGPRWDWNKRERYIAIPDTAPNISTKFGVAIVTIV